MSRLSIEHPAPEGGWDAVRPALESALAKGLPVRVEERWEDEALHLEGAGAKATIRLVDGHVRADAELGPPASFFRSAIERELRRALARLG